MATKSTKTIRGAKTAKIIELAQRPQGVTGKEIQTATGWKSGSAAWRVSVLADRLGHDFGWARRENDPRQVGYFFVPRTPATKRTRKAA